MASRTPQERLRRALTVPSSSPSAPSLDRIQRLFERLPSTSEGQNLRNPDGQRRTSLHLATQAGRVDVVAWLLDEGSEEEEVSRDSAGETAVHVAANEGHAKILDLYLARYPFVVDWVNSRNLTPLHLACMKGHAEAAQVLIDMGADIDVPDMDGNSPLHMASAYGHLSVVKLLIDLDCISDPRNNDGFSATDFAYTKALMKELEVLVKQRYDEVKAAKKASRQQRRSKSSAQTIRSKRQGSSSALSIALPPLPSSSSTPDAFTTSPDAASASTNGFSQPSLPGYNGLGLSYQSSPQLDNDGSSSSSPSFTALPRLGAPIPPTPALNSPESGYSPSLPRNNLPSTLSPASSKTPISEPPTTPRTPTSPYTNTTSPQPSPLSTTAPPSALLDSPTSGVRPGFPDRSSLSLRQISRAPSASSPLATPTSTTAGQPDVEPSPASALSAESTSTGVSSSGQTATPTPASPTPASSRPNHGRQASSKLSSPPLHGFSSQQPLYQPTPISVIEAQRLRDRSSSISSLSSTSAAPPLPSLHLPPSSPPTSPPPPSSPPTSPPRPGGGHKLIRKSRSHAHQQSLSGSGSVLVPPAPPPPSAGFEVVSPRATTGVGGERRSVSGPAGGPGGAGGGGGSGRASVESSRSTLALPFLHTAKSWNSSTSEQRASGGAGGGEGKEEGKKAGSKLRKKEKEHGALELRRKSTSEDGGAKHGSRLARALGLGGGGGKKG